MKTERFPNPITRLLYVRCRRWLALALTSLCAVGLLAPGTSYPAAMMLHLSTALEMRFDRPALSETDKLSGIIVLGGGEERLREAARLAREFNGVRLFVSGAGPEDYVRGILGSGIEPERIAIECLSKTTFQNALYSRNDLLPAVGQRWLLVTSASHMPRSIGAFRQAGFDVVAWPVYDLPAHATEIRSQAALHEWLGLAYYWLRARSSSILPGPHSQVPRAVLARAEVDTSLLIGASAYED